MSEQYDVLLKFLTGHSLKEESELWASFQNLKQARNRFVHEGLASIGKVPVDAAKAEELVRSAPKIIARIREWLPEDIQRRTFDPSVRVEITSKTFPGPDNPEASPTRADSGQKQGSPGSV
ncbi:MAG: hypothetical protein ABSB15_10935 [Bryobacteraceae bacterium]